MIQTQLVYIEIIFQIYLNISNLFHFHLFLNFIKIAYTLLLKNRVCKKRLLTVNFSGVFFSGGGGEISSFQVLKPILFPKLTLCIKI